MVTIIKASDLIKSGTLNTIIYGAPGVGKTTFCATAPKPLIIDLEGGTMSIANTDVDLVQVKDADEVKEAIGYAIKNGYQTICIDSLTRYSEILMEKILRDDRKTKPQIQHWGELVTSIKNSIWKLQQANINTVFVCLEKEVEEDGQLIKRPNLNGQLIQAIPAIVDVVGYLHVSQNGERLVGLNPTSKYYAKHRAPIENRISENLEPNFLTIQNRIYGNANTISK